MRFSLKEGTPDYGTSLVKWGPDGPRSGGYWQGLWTFGNDRTVLIDGGGTRIELASGLALYGWMASDDSIEGGPHFMIRPELFAYLGVLPFLEIGAGIGYQLVAGESDTAIPLDLLSSIAFNIQARVGER